MSEDNPELRLRLRIHLREFIERIDVYAVGHAEDFDPDEVGVVLEPLRKAGVGRARSNGRSGRRTIARGELRSHPEVRAARDGDAFLEYMFDNAAEFAPQLLQDAEWLAFVKDIAARRKTKEGRFLRVHFKTGRTVDLVPPGSLASGVEMVKDGTRKAGWRFVSPGLKREWRSKSTVNRI